MVVASSCGSSEPTLAGYEREPEPTVGSLSLPAVNRDNADFAFRAEPEGLLIVYFGYASCPDVCPTTLSDTRLALAELGDRAASVEVAMVTIDPDRDSPPILSDYVETFIDGAIALRTDDPDALAIAADAFGVTYSVTTNDEGEIEVGHTPFLYVVDDQGAIILTWPFGTPADDLASDLKILLDRRA
jgi:protein SCO1/2